MLVFPASHNFMWFYITETATPEECVPRTCLDNIMLLVNLLEFIFDSVHIQCPCGIEILNARSSLKAIWEGVNCTVARTIVKRYGKWGVN